MSIGWYSRAYVRVRLLRRESSTCGWVGGLPTGWAEGAGGTRSATPNDRGKLCSGPLEGPQDPVRRVSLSETSTQRSEGSRRHNVLNACPVTRGHGGNTTTTEGGDDGHSSGAVSQQREQHRKTPAQTSAAVHKHDQTMNPPCHAPQCVCWSVPLCVRARHTDTDTRQLNLRSHTANAVCSV